MDRIDLRHHAIIEAHAQLIRFVQRGTMTSFDAAKLAVAHGDALVDALTVDASDEHAGPVVGRKGDQGADHEGPSASVDAQDVCNQCGAELGRDEFHYASCSVQTQDKCTCLPLGNLALLSSGDCPLHAQDDTTSCKPHQWAKVTTGKETCARCGTTRTLTQNACPDCKLLGKWCGVHGAQAQQGDTK